MSEPVKHPRALRQVLAGEVPHRRPVWLMRQAGRYLPEYRKVRADAGSFLDLCYAPELASEVTLQPIRRYDFDAAIIFSDILVVPHALGQTVRFEEGEGPRLDPIRSVADLSRLDLARAPEKFAIVAEAIRRTRAALPDGTSLIGFCGAPWTVATYMVGGRGSTDQADTRLWAHRDPAGFQQLMDLLVTASIAHLNSQAAAGADVLQIFDSWSGSLDEDGFRRWVMEPTARIVAGVKAVHRDVPIIGFPRGGGLHVPAYLEATGVDAVGCDTAMPLAAMQDFARRTAVQGNLDPLLLVTGGERMRSRVARLMAGLPAHRHIVNLGHGIVPETPPDHVAELVDLVRKG